MSDTTLTEDQAAAWVALAPSQRAAILAHMAATATLDDGLSEFGPTLYPQAPRAATRSAATFDRRSARYGATAKEAAAASAARKAATGARYTARDTFRVVAANPKRPGTEGAYRFGLMERFDGQPVSALEAAYAADHRARGFFAADMNYNLRDGSVAVEPRA